MFAQRCLFSWCLTNVHGNHTRFIRDGREGGRYRVPKSDRSKRLQTLERDRLTETDRQTDRQTDKQTERQIDREEEEEEEEEEKKEEEEEDEERKL